MRESLETALDALIQKYSDELYDFSSPDVASNFEADIFAIKASIVALVNEAISWKVISERNAEACQDLAAEVDRLRGAPNYHQEQTRPIQRTIDVLEGTK